MPNLIMDRPVVGRGRRALGVRVPKPALVAVPVALATLLPATPVAAVSAAGPDGSPAAGVRALTTATSANSRISSVLPGRTSSAILGSRFTMTVWDTAEDRFVFSKRSEAALRGASITKILTAVAVLETLGPDHRMPTTVLAGGGTELVLRAGGDPLLKSADLRSLARDTATALRTGGVGASASPSAPDPLPAASPSITPDASAPITVDPTSPAPTPSLVSAASRVAAAASYTVRADDSLFPGSGHSRGWPNSFLPSQVRPVNAFARDDNKARDAAADAGRYFAAALRQAGIKATYAGEGQAPSGAQTLATYAGHTVGQAVSRALLVSDNDTAEMLFRQVAVGRGRTADWAGAREAERAALADLGVPLSGVEIVDGSGLSLEGRLTAGALSTALLRALSPSHPRLSGLRGWLPVAGRSGTLARSAGRFNTSPAKCAAGMIQAKTGTLADAISLAGYARGADGNTKVFVAVVNGRPTKWSRLTTRRYVDRAVSSLTGCW